MILYGLLGINTGIIMRDLTIHSDENSDSEDPNWIEEHDSKHDILYRHCKAEEIHPVLALFFFTLLNGIGSPMNPYHSYFSVGLGDYQFGILENLVKGFFFYCLWFLWFINQYILYIFFFRLIIVITISNYKKSKIIEYVFLYQKKAQLNKRCLVYTQSWLTPETNDSDTMDCCLLSANTFETNDDQN
jgi:hypothetical protein